MPVVAGIGVGAVDVLLIFGLLLITALAVRILDQVALTTQGWPAVGGLLSGLANRTRDGIGDLANLVLGVAVQLLTWAFQLVHAAISAVVTAFTAPIAAVAASLQLAVQVAERKAGEAVAAVERIPGEIRAEVPQVFKDLFPRVPDPIGGLRRLLGLLPVLVILAEQLFDWLAQVPKAISDLHDLQQVVYRVQKELLVVEGDLQQERMARLAAEQQLRMAQQAAQTAQDARQAQDRSQWSPLLPLTVLAVLGGTALDVLRKTSRCDPCKQLDDQLPGLKERVEALEAFGE